MTEAQYETRQRVKKRLSAYLDAKREYKQIEERLEALNARLVSLGSPRLDGMPRSGSGGDNKPDLLDAKDRLVERYMVIGAELMKTQLEIEDEIKWLDSVERVLIRHRYIEGLSWEQVCVALGYSWRQTHNIHARALDRLAELEAVSV